VGGFALECPSMKDSQSIADKLISVLEGLTIDEATRELKGAIEALQVTQVVQVNEKSNRLNPQ
jgi:hypothetical protein